MSPEPTRQRWWQMSLTKPPRFSWKAPKDYQQLKGRSELPRLRRLLPWLFAFYFGGLMLLWWLARVKKGETFDDFGECALIALFGAALFSYGLAWMYLKFPTEVSITERWIGHSRFHSKRQWSFTKLESFCWVAMSEGVVLRLKFKTGREVSLGAPLELGRDEVEAFLQQHGLLKTADGQWSNYEDLAFLRNAL